jgi:AraC family transcriptional regulator, transcriptional activator of pobA
LEVLSIYKNISNKEIEVNTSRKKEIIQNFLHNLYVHYRQERSVEFYAEKLFITPGYLSKILKEASGMTAREIIEDVVIMESRDMLLNTSMSISQISEKLSFSDQSFFGKFFKKKMKMSPKIFRENNR